MASEGKVVEDETAWCGRFMEVRLVKVIESTGKKNAAKTREMAVRKHRVVCILPLTKDGKLILIRQPRIYFDRYQRPEERITLEFPAGKVGDNDIFETMEEAARRELEEETGYVAGKLIFLFKESVSAGILSEERYCYFAPRVESGVKEDSEESDRIEVLLIDISRIRVFLREQIEQGVEIDSGIRSMLFAIFHELEEDYAHEITMPRQQDICL